MASEKVKKFDRKAFGRKVSLLMKALDKNQTQVADTAELSRVSLNRFLRGQSELRLSDFVRMMQILGVDIDKVVADRLEEATGEKEGRLKDIGPDMELVLNSMSRLGKQSYLGHLVAYAELLGPRIPAQSYKRLMAEYETTL